MKKAIILVTLLLSIHSFAQKGYVAVSAAFDIKNTIVGSTPTNDKPELDVFLQFTAVGNKGTEVSFGYEYFPRINFSKFTLGAGQTFPLYGYIRGHEIKTILFLGLEPTMINRWGTWGGGITDENNVSFLSLGGNVALRWFLSDRFAIEALFNALPRTDSRYMYGNSQTNVLSIQGTPIVGSFYGKVIVKLN